MQLRLSFFSSSSTIKDYLIDIATFNPQHACCNGKSHLYYYTFPLYERNHRSVKNELLPAPPCCSLAAMFVQHKNTSSSVSPCVASPSLSLPLNSTRRPKMDGPNHLFPSPFASSRRRRYTCYYKGGGEGKGNSVGKRRFYSLP